MQYAGVARLVKSKGVVKCNGTSLIIPHGSDMISVVVAAATNYDQKAGNAGSNYSFKGADPKQNVQATASRAAAKDEHCIRKLHMTDY